MMKMKSRTGLSLAASLFLAVGLTVIAATPASAWDSWWGSRTCSSIESCRLVSTSGSGLVIHEKDGGVLGSWSNVGGQTRTSWGGSGTHSYAISTESSMTGYSATCICIVSNCPV